MVYGGAPPLATAAFNRRILPFQVEHSRYGQPRGEAWLDPPAEVAEFFAREYPAMTHIETRVTALRTSGYVVGLRDDVTITPPPQNRAYQSPRTTAQAIYVPQEAHCCCESDDGTCDEPTVD